MKCKIETSNGIMFLKGIDGDKRLEIADFILMEHVAKLQEIRDYDRLFKSRFYCLTITIPSISSFC